MSRPARSALAVPLVVVALLGAALGFFVTRQLAPQGAADAARLSVVAMPSASTPSPEPTEEPTPEPTPTDDIDDGSEPRRPSGRGGTGGNRTGNDGGSGSCPAGCTCEARPPAGVAIVCRGS